MHELAGGAHQFDRSGRQRGTVQNSSSSPRLPALAAIRSATAATTRTARQAHCVREWFRPIHTTRAQPVRRSGNPSVVNFQTGSVARYFVATGFDASGRLTLILERQRHCAVTASQPAQEARRTSRLTLDGQEHGSANSSPHLRRSGTIQLKATSAALCGRWRHLADVILPATGGITISKQVVERSTSTPAAKPEHRLELTPRSINQTTLALARIVQLGS